MIHGLGHTAGESPGSQEGNDGTSGASAEPIICPIFFGIARASNRDANNPG
jgi:hypothetical protein